VRELAAEVVTYSQGRQQDDLTVMVIRPSEVKRND